MLKVTRNTRMIWCLISSIEAVDIKHDQQKSRLTVLFLFMVLSVEIYILNYSWVYNLNTDENRSDMKISLTSNPFTEWVATLLPITSHWRSSMVIVEVCPVWMPVLASLVFTVDAVYYDGFCFELATVFPDFSHGSNLKWRYKEVDFWFGSVWISFLAETRHKFDSWPRLFPLKVNIMLYKA